MYGENLVQLTWEVMIGKMDNKKFSTNINSLETQMKELTNLVATLSKTQNPSSSIQESQVSPQFNKNYRTLMNMLLLHLPKIHNHIALRKHLH